MLSASTGACCAHCCPLHPHPQAFVRLYFARSPLRGKDNVFADNAGLTDMQYRRPGRFRRARSVGGRPRASRHGACPNSERQSCKDCLSGAKKVERTACHGAGNLNQRRALRKNHISHARLSVLNASAQVSRVDLIEWFLCECEAQAQELWSIGETKLKTSVVEYGRPSMTFVQELAPRLNLVGAAEDSTASPRDLDHHEKSSVSSDSAQVSAARNLLPSAYLFPTRDYLILSLLIRILQHVRIGFDVPFSAKAADILVDADVATPKPRSANRENETKIVPVGLVTAQLSVRMLQFRILAFVMIAQDRFSLVSRSSSEAVVKGRDVLTQQVTKRRGRHL
eukprot:6192451-Pleurochrysis_carterae.AAC.9